MGKHAPKLYLKWFPGPSAQLELLNPDPKESPVCRLKYTPPFRSTIRPPLYQCNLGPGELRPIDTDMELLVRGLDIIAGRAPAGPGDAVPGNSTEILQAVGEMLFDLTLPPYIKSDFATNTMFLELGVDEKLLSYPWELMHDGKDFLCLKHDIGRFVNASSSVHAQQMRTTWADDGEQQLNVLLISVPNPQPRDNRAPDRLQQAEAETEAIIKILTGLDHVKLEVLKGSKASYTPVRTELKKNYHIVHYCGHADFNDKDPRQSALMLFDRDMTTGALASFIGLAKPVLCFINGCDTLRIGGGKDRLDLYGLAQAFLETGAYLLGTRWKVEDVAASTFSTAFYSSFLGESRPLGRAVREARLAARKEAPKDLAWASYLLYGDPRVCFGRRAEEDEHMGADDEPWHD